MKYFIWISLSVLILLSACSTPRYSLKPYKTENTFTEGNIVYSKQQQDSVNIIVGYYKTDGNYLITDVEIGNYSDDTIYFDPAQSYYSLVDPSTGNVVQSKNTTFPPISTVNAFDPDQEIMAIDQKIKAHEQKIKTTRTILTVLAVVVTVVAIAAIMNSSSKSKSRNDRSFRVANSVNNWTTSMRIIGAATFNARQNFNYDVNNLNGLRNTWQSMPLRKIAIPPKEKIRGDMIFRPVPENACLDFVYRVGSYKFDFFFNQLYLK